MKQRSKKGFSLIELIVVIAVIAAIAAVIVPQFSNLTGAAKNATDLRNVQLWNDAYANAYALSSGGQATIGGTSMPTASVLSGNDVSALGVQFNLSGQLVNFNAPAFTLGGTWTSKNFVAGEGLHVNP